MKKTAIAKTIDEYMAPFPPKIRALLKQMRSAIRAAAPGAGEKISYRMPTFTLNGRNLVHFAAFQHHIGFFPTASGIAAFQREIAKYTWAKGSVQFPLDEPLPLDLVKRIVKYRVAENMKKA
jgi:uncharacterized protein YdhG (YjbR/CyaY superfamily)